MFKSSQRHEGSLADMSKSTLIFHNSDRYLVLSGICTCQPRLQTSVAPVGIFTCFAHCFQGGGVYVARGNLNTCTQKLDAERSLDLEFGKGAGDDKYVKTHNKTHTNIIVM